MVFQIPLNADVQRDGEGIIRHINHLQQPYTAPDLPLPTPRELATRYVHDVAPIYDLGTDMLKNLDENVGNKIVDEGSMLRFAHDKTVMGISLVSYSQTFFSLQVWEAGFSVTMRGSPLRVTSSQSTVRFNVEVKKPDENSNFMPERIDALTLVKILGRPTEEDKSLKINATKLLVYQYNPDTRLELQSKQVEQVFEDSPPTLPLQEPPDAIRPGVHYVVTDVLFTLPLPGYGEINWRAFIEVETGAVLYLRALVACASGLVYRTDPLTATGDSSITPSSPAAVLDRTAPTALRTSVSLDGLTSPNPGQPQALTGRFIRLTDLSQPNIAPPSEISGNFNYSALSDNFAAVNAYYHLDSLFRMIQSWGFDTGTYMPNTTFPIPTDHRGSVWPCCNPTPVPIYCPGPPGTSPPTTYGNCVNARCQGNTMSNGIGDFQFALAQMNQPVGIAADVRIVMHEFCHGLLWNSVHSPNFGFAHSAGDSLAAILNDPGSLAPDRGRTFPWSTILRRHDRPVSDWAWGGAIDLADAGGYNKEQILSTTLFRIYNSTGGGSTRLDIQRIASRYVAYLIIKAIFSLGINGIIPTPTANVYETSLEEADVDTEILETIPGGALYKVIRWAFEQQGLYQSPGAPSPVTQVGAPPPIDVYINDGRDGGYQYLEHFWENTDVWNRHRAYVGPIPTTPDHEEPWLNVPNFVYVKVKNRGTTTANNVVVKGYHCRPSTSLVWPSGWEPMTTDHLPTAGSRINIPAGGQTVVGPFEWTPSIAGHECILMIASAGFDPLDDPSTTHTISRPIPHWRLVPFDNNIAQRNVAPVAGGGGATGLADSFKNRHFWADNPYDRTTSMVIEAVLPPFLEKRNWRVRFLNPEGHKFELKTKTSTEVVFSLEEGEDFKSSDVEEDSAIRMIATIDGLVVGGMTYYIDPKMKTAPVDHPA
jgi:zinc metalloprotease ZmpB